jgi:hypothetical protein
MHWATIITSIGALLGGLALPLAFIQLGAQRQDRLRAQVAKIGAWASEWTASITNEDASLQQDMHKPTRESHRQVWSSTVFIRNSSELPVMVDKARLFVLSKSNKTSILSLRIWATVAPGQTIEKVFDYLERPGSERPEPRDAPSVAMTVIDAAGRTWDVAPYIGGPPRHIGWLRRKWRSRYIIDELGLPQLDL